jgi:hypothetical protein
LDGNNLAGSQRSEQIERERCSFRTVIDFHHATAGPFQRKIEMLRGQNDRALRCGQLVQEIFSLEFISERCSKESEDGGVCQRLGEIVERAKRPQIVHERRRTRQNNGELEVDCFARRPGQKEKNKRPKGN